MSSWPDSRRRRIVDLVLASLLLVVTAPVLLIVGAVVRLRIGRPVLFLDRRAGRGGQPFTMYKFRTMSDARDANSTLLADEHRLERVGRWLRATSVDELPQLWNVVRGDMSLVGPRPLPESYLARYTPRQRRRIDVLPGMTGWAQVHGRNSLSWPDKLELDAWYVDHASAALDLTVLRRSVGAVVARQGINADGHATAPELPDQASSGHGCDQVSDADDDADDGAASRR